MRDKVRLKSPFGTGYCYYTTKNKRNMTGKMKKKKYDPVAGKHGEFTEVKLK